MLSNKPSFELNLFSYTFAPRLITTLLAFVCIPILISLGLWQLDRADEKRIIDQGVNDAIAKPALVLNQADIESINKEIYRTALIQGQYDDTKQFLLDNRTYKGQPGYHVISPMTFKNNLVDNTTYGVLINRGWIKYNGTRDQIRNISVNKELTQIEGTIKSIPQSIVLKDAAHDEISSTVVFKVKDKQLNGVRLIQSIELDRLEKALNYKLLPVIIELKPTVENGFIREWQPYYGSIDKHNAYALQWFAMASILLFLFIKLNIRKR